jgi:hypothetical protein
MDKDKVANLAKSFSLSCKQIVKGNQLAQKLTSPVVTLIALTVLKTILDDGGIDKRIGWGW